MTTAELLHLIDLETARHRVPGHHHDLPGSPCVATIGSLTGTYATRRAIEEAIQQARLDGIPVITDGGLRVAATDEEWDALVGWLYARIRTQRLTVIRLRLADRRRRKKADAMATPPAVLFPEMETAA